MSDVVHVEFDWVNEFGLCDECGDLPAAYWAPDVVFTRMHLDGTREVITGQSLCPICAALWASHGEKLERLFGDEGEGDDPPKIRVYKRDPKAPNPLGFSPDRPWMVSGTPEDSRETCYPTWEGAMWWATMPHEKRAQIIEIENLMEGGW